MAREMTLRAVLDGARIRVHREMVTALLANLPASTPLGELLEALAASPFREAAESLTIGDLRDALAGPTIPVQRPSPRAESVEQKADDATAKRVVNTRTRAGRAVLDTAVRDLLIAKGPSPIEVITANVPGVETQVRQALARLAKAGEVVGRGESSDVEYAVASSIVAMAEASAGRREVAAAS